MTQSDQKHDHTHGFGSGTAAGHTRLVWVLGLAMVFSIVELFGGWLTDSLALLADAFHLVSDVAALIISVFAAWLTGRPSSAQRTFGHSRAEILAALANGVGLAVAACIIMYSAIGRFAHPASVDGLGVVGFASAALFYELISLWLLHRGAQGNLNMRGAFLHILSDALGSLGAIVSGLSIWAWGWAWADPLTSLFISLLVLSSAWRLVREAVDVLMESAPAHLDVDEIRDALLAIPSISGIHDFHVWTVGSGEICLASHVVATENAETSEVLEATQIVLRENYSIRHMTIQVERAEPGKAPPGPAPSDCDGACPD